MAVIRTSPLVGAIKGKVGGVTFVVSGRGAQVRGCASTVRRDGVGNLRARARIGGAVSGWLALTDAQRAAWVVRAASMTRLNAVGVARGMGGWELFGAVWVRAQMLGTAVPVSPPSVIVGSAARITRVRSYTTGLVQVYVSVPGASYPWKGFVWVATQRVGSNRSVRRRWHYCGRYSTYTGNWDVQVQESAVLGWIPPAGTQVRLRAESVTGCYMSAPAEVVYRWGAGDVYY